MGSWELGWPTIRKWKLCQYLYENIVNLFFFLLKFRATIKFVLMYTNCITIDCAANHCVYDKMKTKE